MIIKRNVWGMAKFIAFSIIVVLSIGLFGDILCNKERTGDDAFRTYNDLDVVFIGSSHVYRTYIPQMLYDNTGIRSANLASSTQSIPSSYWLFRELLYHQTPKVVVIDVFPAVSNSRVAFATRLLPTYSWVKYAATLDLLNSEIDWTDCFRFFAFHTQYEGLSKNDWDYLFRADNSAKEKWYSMHIETDTISNSKIEKIYKTKTDVDEMRDLKYLKLIVSLAKKNNIQLVFVNSPYIETYDQAAFSESVYELAKSESIPFFDFANMTDEIGINLETDYADQGHTNYNGNSKITEWIGNYLKSNYTFQLNNQDYEEWEQNSHNYESHNAMLQLKDTIDFHKYLLLIDQINKDCIILVTADGNLTSALNANEKGTMNGLGLQNLASMDESKYFAAIIHNGTVKKELMSTDQCSIYHNIDGNSIKLFSQKDNKTIQFAGKEISKLTDPVVFSIIKVSSNELMDTVGFSFIDGKFIAHRK